jgi:5-formyltetrahydrofolate cyclo-ligase
VSALARIQTLACSGKRLFVPRIIDKAGGMDFFEVYDEEDLAALPSGVWGIKEPESHYKTNIRESGR